MSIPAAPPAAVLRDEIAAALPRLRAISEERSLEARGEGKWVRREILGHLIDSAANNHQRFIRARVSNPFVWPGYDQNAWVAAHAYRTRRWHDLLELWLAMNEQIAAAMASVPLDRYATTCIIGDAEPASLEWWMRDYVRHMRHHLQQIFDA
jgi:hypothetical protein